MRGRLRNHQAGLSAEEIAMRHYARDGARLLERRWRCAEGEIDLIFAGLDETIFIEVKARRTLETAARSVSPAQWRRIGMAAMRFLAERGLDTRPCRFDLVLVDGSGRSERIENAASFEDG